MPNSFFTVLFGVVILITGCQEPIAKPTEPGVNNVAVIGAIHGGHKKSEQYSLDILRDAIIEYEPEVILVELPPDRFEKASENFKQYGEVRESRADDFPELVDVVFPLQGELGFTMIPVAAWTQDIADNRRAKMRQLENDPSRAEDWAEYQAAIKTFNETVSGKSDDPEFIHSDDYDLAVKARQETLERLFGSDLGAGGWKNINMAHLDLINAALDDLDGQEKRVLILYGAWHKYKIREGLEGRAGIKLTDADNLF